MNCNELKIMKKVRIQDLKEKKRLVCLTAYTAPMAELIDKFTDIILVGDSLGPVLYGYKTTREVSLDMIINHAKAVVKKSKTSFVVVDMPYGTYEHSKSVALRNAKEIIRNSGADAVKLEGGYKIHKTIHHLTKNKIKVMGHLGMLPQSIKGKPTVYGKKKTEKIQIIEDLKLIEKAGVFAIVIECTLESLVNKLIEIKKVPLIGIGASKKCEGQILVTEDILGITKFRSRFLKKYMDFDSDAKNAISKFSKEVNNYKYPTKKHCYK